jgi:hypothetical protein
MSDDQTFLIAVTVTGWPSRTRARRHVYDLMAEAQRTGFPGVAGRVDSWWDASVDHADGHDNGEAVWTHHGRGIEAQQVLVMKGWAPSTDMALGPHPSLTVVRNDRGELMIFECDRCNNGSDDPAVLAEVPCEDVSKWEHGHFWHSNEADPIQIIECLSDCGMTVRFGRFVGEVSDEHAGSPPD